MKKIKKIIVTLFCLILMFSTSATGSTFFKMFIKSLNMHDIELSFYIFFASFSNLAVSLVLLCVFIITIKENKKNEQEI